ncbi:hypothetical protein ANCCAN_04444, partial [Ancylostoma caninum]
LSSVNFADPLLREFHTHCKTCSNFGKLDIVEVDVFPFPVFTCVYQYYKMYIGKRLICDRNITSDHPHQDYAALSAEPISVVDDVCAENEEDGYEEMDEEDEECPTLDAATPVVSYKEAESIGWSPLFLIATNKIMQLFLLTQRSPNALFAVEHPLQKRDYSNGPMTGRYANHGSI